MKAQEETARATERNLVKALATTVKLILEEEETISDGWWIDSIAMSAREWSLDVLGDYGLMEVRRGGRIIARWNEAGREFLCSGKLPEIDENPVREEKAVRAMMKLIGQCAGQENSGLVWRYCAQGRGESAQAAVDALKPYGIDNLLDRAFDNSYISEAFARYRKAYAKC